MTLKGKKTDWYFCEIIPLAKVLTSICFRRMRLKWKGENMLDVLKLPLPLYFPYGAVRKNVVYSPAHSCARSMPSISTALSQAQASASFAWLSCNSCPAEPTFLHSLPSGTSSIILIPWFQAAKKKVKGLGVWLLPPHFKNYAQKDQQNNSSQYRNLGKKVTNIPEIISLGEKTWRNGFYMYKESFSKKENCLETLRKKN